MVTDSITSRNLFYLLTLVDSVKYDNHYSGDGNILVNEEQSKNSL